MSITSVPTPERCRHVDQACSHVSLAIFCAVDLFQAYWWGLAHSWQSNFGLFGFAEVEAQLSFCAMDLPFCVESISSHLKRPKFAGNQMPGSTLPNLATCDVAGLGGCMLLILD